MGPYLLDGGRTAVARSQLRERTAVWKKILKEIIIMQNIIQKNYYESKLFQFKNDASKVWGVINNMIKPNQKNKKLVIERLVRDGVVVEAEQEYL